MGWLDERSFLSFIGRKIDQIEINGSLITSTLLDGILSKHPSVENACFFAVPTTSGQEIEAAVVFKAGLSVTASELKTWMQSLLPFHIKITFHFVDRLPQTSMGKLLKHRLISQVKTKI